MPEKTVNEIPRDVRAMFTKGNDALLRDNFDYAIDLLMQVLAREPTFFDARKALRSAQQGKSGGGGAGGFFKKAWSSASSSPMVAKGQLALRKDPVEALAIAEQVLNTDPNNTGAHKIIVEAAAALEMTRTAVMSLDVLVRNSPKDKTLAIEFATKLADTGDVKRAEKILEDFLRLLPNDGELAQARKNVSAKRTLGEGGYDKIAGGEGSYRDILRNETEAVQLEH